MGVDYFRKKYEEFLRNLWACSMYGYCYIFPIQVYIIKLIYTPYTMQLEENSNLVKFSLVLIYRRVFLPFIFFIHTYI